MIDVMQDDKVYSGLILWITHVRVDMNEVKISARFDQGADVILHEGDCLDLLPQILTS